jgi:hypothetical protein
LNYKDKRLLVYNKIDKSQCAIIYIQETKCENLDHSFIRTFHPKIYDQFVCSPCEGASGGIIVLWNSAIFDGQLLQIHRSTTRVCFSSKHTGESWTLVTVYGPCQGIQRDIFVQWLHDLDILENDN